MVDNAGKVFWWNGVIFRAIKKEYEKFYLDLLKNPKLHSLYKAGLVPAEKTGFTLEGFPLVLKHERIPFLSFCMEWSSEMLKDAAVMMCNLSMYLHEIGLTIKDAHPWNVLFHEGRPLFVDWGSIIPVKAGASWPYTEFRAWFLYPLFLMSAGQNNIARALMLDMPTPQIPKSVYKLLLNEISPIREIEYLLKDRHYLKKGIECLHRFL